MAKAKLDILKMTAEQRAALIAALTTGNVESVEVSVSSEYISRKEKPADDAPAKLKATAWLHRITEAVKNATIARDGADGVSRTARGAGGKARSEAQKFGDAINKSLASMNEKGIVLSNENKAAIASVVAYVAAECKKQLTARLDILETVKDDLEKFLDKGCPGEFPNLRGVSWDSLRPTVSDIENGSPTAKEIDAAAAN